MLKSYNFWVRLVAVLVLLARVILSEFGIIIDSGLIMDIATAVASVLVVLGVIQVPASTTNNNENGGGFMKNLNQIKEDILKAKEKIESEFGVGEKTQEIGGMLDGIVAYICAEDDETKEVEAVASEVIEPETEGVVGTIEEVSGPIEDVQVESAVVEEERAQIEQEIIESAEVAEKESALSAEEVGKLKEILTAKLREIVERDGEAIIEEILV